MGYFIELNFRLIHYNSHVGGAIGLKLGMLVDLDPKICVNIEPDPGGVWVSVCNPKMGQKLPKSTFLKLKVKFVQGSIRGLD